MNHRRDVHTVSAYSAQNQPMVTGPTGRLTNGPVSTRTVCTPRPTAAGNRRRTATEAVTKPPASRVTTRSTAPIGMITACSARTRNRTAASRRSTRPGSTRARMSSR
jgi:hypothetical protein